MVGEFFGRSENGKVTCGCGDRGKWALKPLLSAKNEWWIVEIAHRLDHKIVGSQFWGVLGEEQKMNKVPKIIEIGRFFN